MMEFWLLFHSKSEGTFIMGKGHVLEEIQFCYLLYIVTQENSKQQNYINFIFQISFLLNLLKSKIVL